MRAASRTELTRILWMDGDYGRRGHRLATQNTGQSEATIILEC